MVFHEITREAIRDAIERTRDLDQSLVDAKTVRIEFFDKEGKRVSTLVARQGQVHQRTNDLEARGNVVVCDTQVAA